MWESEQNGGQLRREVCFPQIHDRSDDFVLREGAPERDGIEIRIADVAAVPDGCFVEFPDIDGKTQTGKYFYWFIDLES